MCKGCGCGCDRECDCGYGSHRHGEGHGHMHRRRFFSKAEKIERLQNYAEALKKELAAVQERIKELRS